MVIRTERLLVRPFRPDDWPDLLVYLALPEIYAFEPGEPIDEARARAMALERSQGSAFRAIELLAERRMVGHLYLAPIAAGELRTYELGYIVSPRDQRRGYATEAVTALVAHAFAAMGAHRVIASCNPENTASWHVLENTGFVREGHLRRNIFFRRDDKNRPRWQDTYVYGQLNPGEDA